MRAKRGRPSKAAVWLVLIGLAWGAAPAAALGAEAGGEPAPRLWIEEPIFEDGRFVPGTVFKHEFVVRNEGGAPLEIKAVRTGCSCAVAGYDRVIPPGSTGRITVTVTIHRQWAGRELRRTVWVSTNDPLADQTRLILRGRVAEAAEAKEESGL